MSVDLDDYRWRNDDEMNLCRRKLDMGWIEINWYENGFKKFVEVVVLDMKEHCANCAWKVIGSELYALKFTDWITLNIYILEIQCASRPSF